MIWSISYTETRTQIGRENGIKRMKDVEESERFHYLVCIFSMFLK